MNPWIVVPLIAAMALSGALVFSGMVLPPPWQGRAAGAGLLLMGLLILGCVGFVFCAAWVFLTSGRLAGP